MSRIYINVEGKNILIKDGVFFHVKAGRKFFGIQVEMIHSRQNVTYVRYFIRGASKNPATLETPLQNFENMIKGYHAAARKLGSYPPKYIPSSFRDKFLLAFEHRLSFGKKLLRTVTHFKDRNDRSTSVMFAGPRENG